MTVNERVFATAPEALNMTPEVIYESRDALEEYLADVRTRREMHCRERQNRKYCLYAIGKLNEELAEAETDGDEEIVRELQEALAEFDRRLETPSASNVRRNSLFGKKSDRVAENGRDAL